MEWIRIIRKLVLAAMLVIAAVVVAPSATLQAQGCTIASCQYACAFDCYYSLTCGQYGEYCNQVLASWCEGEQCWCAWDCRQP